MLHIRSILVIPSAHFVMLSEAKNLPSGIRLWKMLRCPQFFLRVLRVTKKELSCRLQAEQPEIFSKQIFPNSLTHKSHHVKLYLLYELPYGIAQGGLVRGLASHWSWDASPRFISSCCAFYARNVYACASLSPDELQSEYWTDTKRRYMLHNKL